MASFDIKSLFTNIPLTETLNLCVQNSYRNQTHVNNLTKSSFYKLLKITMFESFFIFDGKFFEQCDGVAMCSPLGPTLANVFMCHFENIWLENCPSHFKPIVHRRFVDDTFLLFRSKDHVEKFRNYLNKQHKNIKFTSEIEENGSLSFLDVKISRENNKFVTSVYRKPTFTGVFINFESFVPDIYKRGLIETLLHRSFRLCPNYENFHREIETLKSILKHNTYPHNLVNHCIKKFLNKLFVQRGLNFMVPKRELICVLPYLGKALLDLRTRLRRTIERNLPFCKLKIIFRSKCRLNTLFHFKDSLEKEIHSGIIYRYTCSNCKVTYYGKTFRHFYTRAAEHMGISKLTGKRLKTVMQSAISDHLLQCNCTINFDDFDILAIESNKFKLLLRESLLIKRDKPILNRTKNHFH